MNKLRFLIAALPVYADAVEREWRGEYLDEIVPLEERLNQIRSEKTHLSALWTQRADYYRRKNELETEEGLVQAELDRWACPQAGQTRMLMNTIREDKLSAEFFLEKHVDKITFPDRFHAEFHLKCGLCLREKVMIDITTEDAAILY